MKRYFLLILSVLCMLPVFASRTAEALLDSANAAYAKEDYKKAIVLYEKITASGLEAPELYFNLGNAYFKTNKLSYAILNYERAKHLNPDDEDINFNLQLANQRIIDRIEPLPQLFLTEWKKGMINFFSEKTWSVLSIAALFLSLSLLAVYFSVNKTGVKRLSFLSAIAFFMLSAGLFFTARSSYRQATNNREAIITSSSVSVKGSPHANGTRLFVLHEGTKVKVLNSRNDWTEIKLPNGNVGWIKPADFETIR